MTLFLDLDGVLADFDKVASEILGTNNIYKFEFVHGTDEFWRRINRHPKFFSCLPQMPDAWVLWQAARGLNPVVLTALPKSGAERVDLQKREWVRFNFGTSVPVITCRTEDKPLHCSKGDILVDDRAVVRDNWEKAGGKFILHTSAGDTIHKLEELGVL